LLARRLLSLTLTGLMLLPVAFLPLLLRTCATTLLLTRARSILTALPALLLTALIAILLRLLTSALGVLAHLAALLQLLVIFFAIRRHTQISSNGAVMD